MTKTNDELKQECESLNSKSKQLNDEELNNVTGGIPIKLVGKASVVIGQVTATLAETSLNEGALATKDDNKVE